MTPWPENSLPDDTVHGAKNDAAGSPPARLSGGARLGLVLGWVLALVALAAVLLMWRSQVQMRDQMAQDLALLGTRTRDLTQQLQTAMQQGEQSRSRAAVLEEKVAALDLQRAQAEAMLQTLAQSQQGVMLADVRTALQAAQQQVQLSGSVQPLLLALADAEKRLSAQQQPRMVVVHQAVVQDLARLRSTQLMDVTQLVADLDKVLQRVDAMPLYGSGQPTQQTPPPQAAVVVAPQSRWLRLWQSVKESTMQLVRVRTIGNTPAALMTPEQAGNVREHLRLRLLNARIALLARQSAAARHDLDVAGALLEQYFDAQNASVRSAQHALKQAAQQMQDSELPHIEHTLQALAAAEAHTVTAAVPAPPASAASH